MTQRFYTKPSTTIFFLPTKAGALMAEMAREQHREWMAIINGPRQTPDMRQLQLYTTGTCANPEGSRGGLVEHWNVRWDYGGCQDTAFSGRHEW